MPSVLFTEHSLKIICVEIFWLFSLSLFPPRHRFPPPILLSFFQAVFMPRGPWATSAAAACEAKRSEAAGSPGWPRPLALPRAGGEGRGAPQAPSPRFFVAAGSRAKGAIVQGLLLTPPFPSEKPLSCERGSSPSPPSPPLCHGLPARLPDPFHPSPLPCCALRLPAPSSSSSPPPSILLLAPSSSSSGSNSVGCPG